MPTAPKGKIRFGGCVLDDGRGAVSSPDGNQTVLRPKTHELLRLMLRNPGRVVSRQEILDAVWPNLFVTDDSITQCVLEIRKAMGAGGTDLLKTVPRRGYLLQADVAAEPVRDGPPGSAPGYPEDRYSIAVLPFRKDSADPQEAYFADGIIEGIVHVLSGLDRITVVSRGSALALADTTVDPREVGRRLGVRYGLYGGVRRAGNKLRITTELIACETGAIIRSDRYDGHAEDLFSLQDRIAEQVVATIAPQVRDWELARALRKAPGSLTAYDLVLKALAEIRRMDREALDQGRALLERAIEADPQQGLAYSYLAWGYSLSIAQGWSRDIAADSKAADEAAAKALLFDSQDGFALALRGVLLGYTRQDIDAGRRLVDQAVAMKPSCALAWSWGALIRCWHGEGRDAAEWARKGLRLAPSDPFTFLHAYVLAQALYVAEEFNEAVLRCRDSLALLPHHAPTWRTMIVSLVAQGRLDEVRQPLLRHAMLDPVFNLRAFAARTPFQGRTRDLLIDRLRRAGVPEDQPAAGA